MARRCFAAVTTSRDQPPYSSTQTRPGVPTIIWRKHGCGEHVCIFGTDIDFIEDRKIPTIVEKVGDLRRCTWLQHDARTLSAREITVGDASVGGCVANCLRRFGRIPSVSNAGRVSAREQMARESLASPLPRTAVPRMAHDVHVTRDVRSFDAAPHLQRRVIGDRARQTTVRRVQGEHPERAEPRKVADCTISVYLHVSYGYGRRYRRVGAECCSPTSKQVRRKYSGVPVRQSMDIYCFRYLLFVSGAKSM